MEAPDKIVADLKQVDTEVLGILRPHDDDQAVGKDLRLRGVGKGLGDPLDHLFARQLDATPARSHERDGQWPQFPLIGDELPKPD